MGVLQMHAPLALVALGLLLLLAPVADVGAVPFSVVKTQPKGSAASAGPREKLCAACTQAVEQLEVILSDPELVNESIAIIEAAVCSNIPGDQMTQCNEAVEEYVPVVFAELESEITVSSICVKETHLCPLDPPRAVGAQGPEDCYACRLVVKLLKKHLANPKTQIKIKAYLEARCSLIGNSTLAVECTGAVDKFLPVVFANLDVILNDKKLCKEASLCLAYVHQPHNGVASV